MGRFVEIKKQPLREGCYFDIKMSREFQQNNIDGNLIKVSQRRKQSNKT